MKTIASLVVLAAAPLLADTVRADNPVIVHEWGTFTSLQDENGHALGGINVDDEPVPSFVYDSGGVHNQGGVDVRAYNFGLPPYFPVKGWTPADQDVTMRLETPVMYLYPPKGEAASSVPPLVVHVDFHGGLLSQYYPYAESSGFPNPFPFTQNIKLANCTSGLTWTVARLGSDRKPVDTPNKVWTTPRDVSAPVLEANAQEFDPQANQWVTTGQTEHFLFYRGVGHLDSPLLLNQSSLDAEKRRDLFGWIHRALVASPTFKGPTQQKVPAEAWLADIHADGSCRWESLPIEYGPSEVAIAGKFDASDSRASNLAALKVSMQDALIKEGLYPDEASAMLRTWELSYFKSPGLRFFYIVPRQWVDQTLPLKITGAPVEITRVMIGRIELISDEQKATLARLAQGPVPDLTALRLAAGDAMAKGKYTKQEQTDFYTGARPLTDLGLALAPAIRDYLSLGRFRDALIVHEQQQHPSGHLAQFIKENGLGG